MNNKYVAFRIDTQSIKNYEVVDGFFIRGQSSKDYNWPLLKECENMKEAIEYIKSIRTCSIRQPVYGPNGYEISLK